MGAELYPLFLKLAGRRTVLVGGGRVASARLRGLLRAGAEVTVVAPAVRPELRLPGVVIVERAFAPGDLDGAWLVVSAAPAAVNAQVFRAASERKVFVNSIDDPDTASAYGGGVLRRDGVTVAISTEGRAPALAGLLREGIDAVLPQDLGRWSGAAESLRAGWKSRGVPIEGRRPLLLETLNRLYAENVTS